MKKQIFMALVALSTLVACKKDNDDQPNPNPGPGPNPGTSKVLKRIVETVGGVSTTHTLSYDGNKRLSTVKNSDNSEVVSFTYDGNGNVTKIENKDGDERNVFEFTYNNNLPVSSIFKSYEKDDTQNEVITAQYSMNYTVENALVTKIKMIIPEDPEAEEEGYEVDYILSYTNGNLTKIETSGISAYTATFTYGTKKPILPATFKYILDPAGLSLEFFAKNEILTKTIDYPGTTGDKNITNVYTYDAQGYVLTSNDGSTQTRYEYE